MRLVVFGATGYAGSRIVHEALQRGHEVVAIARNPAPLSEGDRERLTVRAGSLHDKTFVLEVTADADVAVVAIPARKLDDGRRLIEAVPHLVTAAQHNGVRLGVVGGAGSLSVSDGGPRLIDTPDFPEAVKPEASAHAEVLEALRVTPQDVDWFYVSPAAVFGAHAPGQRLGKYRVGGDVLFTDDNGDSTISGEDYATAFVDEIDKPKHHRARLSVAY
jgi:putative NADH-flavin reductase